MLQMPEPEDLVIATGEQHTVREFVTAVAAELGVRLGWQGQGLGESGVVEAVREVNGAPPSAVRPGDVVVRLDPRYLRPAEVNTLIGDASLARTRLGWAPKYGFADLVREMVHDDLTLAVTERAHRAPERQV
jgi:GDPmannose 4,6-dehydratase